MPAETGRTRVSAIILAAGMSKRMGEVKQLLSLGEATLLGRVLEAVQSSQVDECVVILGFAAEAIREKVSLNNAKVVVNEAYSEGMSTSLRAGLANVNPQAEAALVVLADQPFVKAATIDRLIEEYKKSRPQVAIPVHKGFRGNPVLLDRSVFAEAMGLQGDIGCRAIFGSRVKNILKVPVDDAGILIDADSPEEFERLCRACADDRNNPTALLESKSVEDSIEQALTTNTQYIALVSNKKRADEIRRTLEATGLSAARLATLRSPAGLQIGAITPEEIALSILAEIVQQWRRQGAPSKAGQAE